VEFKELSLSGKTMPCSSSDPGCLQAEVVGQASDSGDAHIQCRQSFDDNLGTWLTRERSKKDGERRKKKASTKHCMT